MFFVYSEFFALFLYNLKKVVFKGGVFMLSTVTGGQWFFPLIIVCLILGIVATIAQKKKLTKLKRITDNFAYAILVILLIIEWILYFQKQFNFITPAIYTLVVIYLIGRQLLTRYRSSLLKKLGAKYKQLTIGLATIYIILVTLLLLIGSKFSNPVVVMVSL